MCIPRDTTILGLAMFAVRAKKNERDIPNEAPIALVEGFVRSSGTNTKYNAAIT